MTISQQSFAGLEALSVAVTDLVDAIEARHVTGKATAIGPWTPVLDNLTRYVALIAQARSSNDPVTALKGANLLTTINKGGGDAEQEPVDHVLAEQAFMVTQRAIYAARSLRDDAGIVLR